MANRGRAGLAVALAACLALTFASGAVPRRTQSEASPVDALLAGCPSAAEVAAINADLQLSFEGTLSGGTLVCTAASGSANLTEVQRRVYQTLRVMKALSFARPLPWTAQSLYPWLVSAIDGIRFRTDIDTSFCCSPARFINISVGSNSYLVLTPRWIEPQLGGGLYDLAGLFVHEARHSDGKPHTCGPSDQTIFELGAWGAQYYFGIWTALYSGSLLDAPAPNPGLYRAASIAHAEQLLAASRFCTLPSADLSTTVTDAPDPVAPGAILTYTAQVANAGPASAPEVFLQAETPAGTHFASASPSQGSCVGDGPIGCSLGALTSGAAATVVLRFQVVAGVGSTIAPAAGGWTVHATGSALDVRTIGNSASASTSVAAPAAPPPPTTPHCVGSPGKGGVKRVGTAGDNTLTGTIKNDVLCGAGGNDTLQGFPGRDILRGGSGDDLIRGGRGADHLWGGAGRDKILVRDSARDVVSCGSGFDLVLATHRDVVKPDCERVRRG
jgi:uncharacterized repeat protein (TIGR01451 family)